MFSHSAAELFVHRGGTRMGEQLIRGNGMVYSV